MTWPQAMAVSRMCLPLRLGFKIEHGAKLTRYQVVVTVRDGVSRIFERFEDFETWAKGTP